MQYMKDQDEGDVTQVFERTSGGVCKRVSFSRRLGFLFGGLKQKKPASCQTKLK
jgi:hypothetical protein